MDKGEITKRALIPGYAIKKTVEPGKDELSLPTKGELIAEFDCSYDNGLAAGKWKTSGKDGWVKGCQLKLTKERLYVAHGKQHVSCKWGFPIGVAPSNRGNAIVTLTFPGPQGGTAKVVLPDATPAAFWAEMWRVAPSVRDRLMDMGAVEVLPTQANVSETFAYLGGYALHPTKESVVRVAFNALGVYVTSGIRSRRLMFLAWRDVSDVSVEGMMDPQRQRSLARTVEFGVLGGLAGKQVKSAYLIVTTNLGPAVFHSERTTVPGLHATLGAALVPARAMIAARSAAPLNAPPATAITAPTPHVPSVADELAKLAKLKADGILTDEEFAAQKAKLLT